MTLEHTHEYEQPSAGGSAAEWVVNYLTDPQRYGAKMDMRGVINAAVDSAALTTVTSITAAFTTADTGKTYALASAAGAIMVGTITYSTATSAIMSVAASAAMTNGRLIFGTDDAAAWQAALDAATPGHAVDVANPTYRSLIGSNLNVPVGVRLGRLGRAPFDPQTNPTMNDWGPTLGIVEDSDPFFVLNNGSGFGDVMVYSINQVMSSYGTAIARGPIIQTSTTATAGCFIGSPYFANAYYAIYLRGGRHHVMRPQIGALRNGILIDHGEDVVDIDRLTCHPYWRICEGQIWTPTASTLDQYALDNARALVINRSDAFKVGSVFCLGMYMGVLAIDSLDEQGSECGYGMIGQIDADTVVFGVEVYETQSPGIIISAALLGANGTGVGTAGQYGIRTITGGSEAPRVVLKSWSHRGTWNGAASEQGAGTTLIVPGTNPG